MRNKSDLKENLLAARLEGVVTWTIAHRTMMLTVIGVALAAGLIGSVFVLRRQEKTQIDWTQISRGQSYAGQHRPAEARQIFQEIRDTSPDLDARLHAGFYLAEIALAEKKPDEAIGYLNDVAASASKRPILPLALSNLGFAYEEKGDFQGAANTYRQFMNQFPEHFLAPRIQLSLGRALSKTADAAGAKDALTHLIDLYPTSPWAQNARQILEKLPTHG